MVSNYAAAVVFIIIGNPVRYDSNDFFFWYNGNSVRSKILLIAHFWLLKERPKITASKSEHNYRHHPLNDP